MASVTASTASKAGSAGRSRTSASGPGARVVPGQQLRSGLPFQ